MKLFTIYGLVVPVFLICNYLLIPYIFKSLISVHLYQKYTVYSVYLAAITTGLILWFLGKRINGKILRTYINQRTGKESKIKPNHHFLFIKIQYWPFVLLAWVVYSVLFKVDTILITKYLL